MLCWHRPVSCTWPRQRVEGRPADLEALIELAATWKTDWKRVERSLRSLVDAKGSDPLVRRSSRFSDRLAQAVRQNGENLLQLEKSLELFRRELVADARQLGHTSVALQEEVHRIRCSHSQKHVLGWNAPFEN